MAIIKCRNNKGVTLIELLVSMGILCIILVMVMSMFSYSVKSYKYDDVQWQIQQDARRGVQLITKDVRNAQSISVSADRKQLTLTLSGTGTVAFYISSNKLYREVNSVKNPVVDNASDIVFNWDSVDKILSLDFTTKKSGADNDFKISTKLYSRVN